jgi:hypothetical protein
MYCTLFQGFAKNSLKEPWCCCLLFFWSTGGRHGPLHYAKYILTYTRAPRGSKEDSLQRKRALASSSCQSAPCQGLPLLRLSLLISIQNNGEHNGMTSLNHEKLISSLKQEKQKCLLDKHKLYNTMQVLYDTKILPDEEIFNKNVSLNKNPWKQVNQ